jgi:hypothetical protein
LGPLTRTRIASCRVSGVEVLAIVAVAADDVLGDDTVVVQEAALQH